MKKTWKRALGFPDLSAFLSNRVNAFDLVLKVKKTNLILQFKFKLQNEMRFQIFIAEPNALCFIERPKVYGRKLRKSGSGKRKIHWILNHPWNYPPPPRIIGTWIYKERAKNAIKKSIFLDHNWTKSGKTQLILLDFLPSWRVEQKRIEF